MGSVERGTGRPPRPRRAEDTAGGQGRETRGRATRPLSLQSAASSVH